MSRRRAKRNSGGGAGLAALVLTGATLYGLAAPPGHHHHHGHQATLTSATPGTPAANRALADRMAARRGWTGPQRQCLNTLWMGESAFDQYNTYPSHDTPPSTPSSQITTAYGIPQALPAQKMAAAGPDWQTNPRTQVRWGLGYIEATYGDPCNALAFKRSHGNQGY